ncbi:ABC transporter permease [Halalkalicoccus jeotgali]|nr:ABC transporter permease [Halalkalicoccus jeotgali]
MVALTVAFLTGSTLLIVAASAQPIGLADELRSSGTATVTEDAPEDALTLPIATATREDGTDVTVIGIPANAPSSWNVPSPPDSGFLHGEGNATTIQLEGTDGSVAAAVESQDERYLFPPNWYITTPETVAELGTTETLVLTDSGNQVPTIGVPLRAALGFFLTGQSQLLSLMGAVVSGGAVLVAVTVYSVTRMSVRDRLATIRTARSTGATPRTILGTFALRAAILTTVGVLLGYALGVILPNAVLSAAIYLGFPAALDLGATTQALFILIPAYLGLILIGAVAGAVAAWSAVRDLPAQLSTAIEGRNQSGLVLLDWRTFVPATATLSVFMSVLFVISALTLTAAPVATTTGSTISEPGTAHPLNSQVPMEYTNALQADGVNASAEVMGFAVVDGQPFLTRGVEYESFASVTDAELKEGRMHTSPNEAIVGASLARSLDVEIGETLVLGGSVEEGVSRVTVVGVYTAPGAHEDQLLLSLPTAQHLAGLSNDEVNLIRTDEAIEGSEASSSVTVLDISAPERAVANDTVDVDVTLRNHGTTERSHTVTASLEDEQTEQEVTLGGGEQQTVQLSLPTAGPGDRAIEVNGEASQSITIVDPETPRLRGIPAEAPPGSEPLVEVQTVTNESLANTAVAIDDTTVETDSDGRVRLPVGSTGTREVRVATENGTATAPIEVTADADREPVVSTDVVPKSTTALTAPEVRTTVYNPWNEPIETSIRIIGPGTTTEEQIQLETGERTEYQTSLSRQPPGTYDVQVELSGTVRAETSYEVSGDERAAMALASSGYTNDSSGLDQAIEAAVGNITLLLVALGGLAASMTIGGLSAAMTRAVHSRRQAIGIHRAVGAGPYAVLQIVLRDAFIIGSLGSIGALIVSLLVMQLLDVLGLMTIYGIHIPTLPPVRVVLLTLVIGLGLTLCSATIAVGSLLYRSPAAVLTGDNRVPTRGEIRER